MYCQHGVRIGIPCEWCAADPPVRFNEPPTDKPARPSGEREGDNVSKSERPDLDFGYDFGYAVRLSGKQDKPKPDEPLFVMWLNGLISVEGPVPLRDIDRTRIREALAALREREQQNAQLRAHGVRSAASIVELSERLLEREQQLLQARERYETLKANEDRARVLWQQERIEHEAQLAELRRERDGAIAGEVYQINGAQDRVVIVLDPHGEVLMPYNRIRIMRDKS